MSEISSLHLDVVPTPTPATSTVHRIRVHPERRPNLRHLQVSCIDQIAPRVYNYAIMPFRLRGDVNKAEIFRNLVEGLRQALTASPDFCGKVVPVNTPRDGFAIELDDEGVSIQMLDCTLPENAAVWPFGTYDDLARAHFSVSVFPPEVFCSQEQTSSDGSFRNCFMQVTFLEGGMIVSGSWHHIAYDGPGASHFIRTWARHSAAASRSEIIPAVLKMEPIRPRAPIDQMGLPHQQLKDFPAWKLSNPAGEAEGATRTDGLTGVGDVSHLSEAERKPVISMWHISHANLKKLKAAVGGDGRSRVGTNEALCALIWRHVSLARGLHRQSEHKSSVLSTTCDCRKAIGLHPEYTGNACEPNAYTRLDLAQVCQPGDASLWQTCQKIKQAISQVDSTAVRRLIGLLKQMPSATHLTWNCDRWPGPDMLISNLLEASWTNFDWGIVMGRPEVGRFLVGPDSPVDGRTFILPRSQDNKGIEIMVRYPQGILDNLCADPVWSEYMQLWYN